MKKTVCGIMFAVLALVLAFTAVGCSGTETPQTEKYTVAVTGGTGGGEFEKNADCTVTATVGAGKVFVAWTADGKSVSTSNPYTFKVTNEIALTAVLQNAYTVTVTGGKIDGKTTVTVAEGNEVTAVADTATGKRFLGWYAGETLLSPDTEYKFAVSADMSIEAKYANIYTVTVVGGTAGGAESVAADAGAEVTVDAVVPAGKYFIRWTIDGNEVSVSLSYTFNVTKDVTVTAEFGDIVQLVRPRNDANQMFNKKPSGYSDMIVELDRQKGENDEKVTAFTDGVAYVAFHLYTSPTAEKTDRVGSFKMVQTVKDKDAAIKTMDDALSIGIGSTPGDYFFDRVSNADFFALIAAAVGDDYDKFQDYYVAAQSIALPGSAFSDSEISEIGSSMIRQAEARSLTVNGGTGGGRYEKGTQCTATATVPDGKYFVKWTSGGIDVSTDNPYEFALNEDITLDAVFADIPTGEFTVSVVGGTGGGSFAAGEQCTVVPEVPSGKGFVRWTVDGTEVSTSYSYTFTVTDSVTVTAEFGDLVQLTAPDNDNNQMFNYLGFGDGRNTTEFDRQKDADGNPVTAFVDGVDHVLYYIYTSADADKSAYVGTFKMVQTTKGADAAIQTTDGALSIGIGNTPGNYYIDNTGKEQFYAFFAAAIGADYSETQTYYFAAQSIAVEHSVYTDSEISAIGTSSIRHTAA